MKNILNKIKTAFKKIKDALNLSLKLSMANSYISLLEEYLNESRERVAVLWAEKERVESSLELERSKNAIARDRTKRLTELLEQMRERLHERGATDAERQFIKVSLRIYGNGKMMSKRRFEHHLYSIQRQRELVDTRREVKYDGVPKMDDNAG